MNDRAGSVAKNTADAEIGSRIDASVEERFDRLVRFRRRLHAEPEPSGDERQTSALIAQTLREAGLEPRIMRGGVGVVGDLDLGAGSNSFIALRADIDCVRVHDEKSVPYRSTRDGLAHACGHDAHTTMLLGTGLTLHELRGAGLSSPRHNVRLIFQPAEETATGARSMIDQGAIDGVAAILAMHVEPTRPVGVLGVRDGYLTASCKRFRATVRGRGGHSARPNEGIDPVPAIAELVSQFHTLVPRAVDAREPVVVTVASMSAGTTFNVIPDDGSIIGTLRALSPEASNAAQSRMQAIAAGVARSTGCTIDLEFDLFCPPTENDPALNAIFAGAAAEALGPDAVERIALPSLGGEDFAFYQELIPGAMIRLGTGLDGRARQPLHSSHFDIDERALGVGVRVFARAAMRAAADYVPRRA